MTIERHLETLEAHDLIRLAQTEPELEYLFRHALVQEAAYDSLLKQERRQLHRMVGQVLEQLYPERRDELAATLAHHFSQAGDDQQALRYFVLAGDVAYRQYAVSEAVTHYSRALEIVRRLGGEPPHTSLQHLYTHLGRALELNARYEQALDVYVELETLARTRGDQGLELTAIMERARIHSTPNPALDPKRGQPLAHRALALADQLGDRAAKARIHWILLLNWPRGDDLEQALAHGEQSLALARELGLREQLAYTLHDIHRLYDYVGQPAHARESLAEAQGLWRELNNLPLLADNLNSTADQLFATGEYDRALDSANEALRLSESIGNLWNQAYAHEVIGRVYAERGTMDQAFQAMQQAIELSERAGLQIITGRTHLDLAQAYAALGATASARQTIHQVRTMLEEIDSLFYTFFRVRAMAIEIQIHDLDAAEDVSREPGATAYTPSLQIQAELALARGQIEEALAFANRLIARGRKHHQRNDLVEAQFLQSRILLAQGDVDAARDTLHQAMSGARTLGARHKLWRILQALSELESQCGNPAAASDWCQQAREVIEYIAAHVDEPNLRDTFLGLPGVQAMRGTTADGRPRTADDREE